MNKETSQRIKELRIRRGYSQNELANGSGLNLRTIQRIESGDSEPLGNSIRRIAEVLKVTPEELMKSESDVDNSFPLVINLSALAFLLFPLLGAILPYVLWRKSKDGSNGLDQIAKEVVNFQITWNLIYYVGLYTISLFMFPMLFLLLMYGFNIALILLNAIFIHMGRDPWYYPKVAFLKT